MSAILIQGIGFIGVLFFIISYQIKSNKALFLCQGMGSAMFCLQFLLLGAYTGCVSLAVIILRNGLLMKYNEWSFVRSRVWVPVFSAIALAIMIITWKDWTSVLPFISMVAGTTAYWTNSARNIRLANLVLCCPCWVLYDIIIGSLGGILNESITIASILISIYRFGWKNLGSEEFGASKKKGEKIDE
jgi:hypothetical protein